MNLVFGKNGQIATELQRLGNVVAFGRNKVNLLNPDACADLIRTQAPSAVINAAAYTDVDKAENDFNIATIINAHAPTAMAKACKKIGIPFIHISTDYVFKGDGKKCWKTDDPVEPQNAYGQSKLTGEIGIRASGAIHVILRTSWVVSAHSSNFVKTMLKLSERHDQLNIVADQIGGPTPARDIATACLKIISQLKQDPKKSGTYHFSGTPDISWSQFAKEIFKKAERMVAVNPIKSLNYPTPASRPLNSRLECCKTEEVFGIMRPDWRKGLNDIIKELEV